MGKLLQSEFGPELKAFLDDVYGVATKQVLQGAQDLQSNPIASLPSPLPDSGTAPSSPQAEAQAIPDPVASLDPPASQLPVVEVTPERDVEASQA